MRFIAGSEGARQAWGRPLVLVEDDRVDLDSIDVLAAAGLGVDVVVCSGPTACGDVCPLVLDGDCPVGRPDVVVCGLSGEWRPSVENAWRAEGVPVVSVDGPLTWPSHVGAALTQSSE
jgi:hypothetical protein